MVNAKAVYDELQTARTHPEEIPAVAGSGVYALFAREADCLLPEIMLKEDGLLYMGMSRDLRERDHFLAQHSGFSSPRRSLGAILSARLGLTAIPRASGPSKSNVANFRFAGDGERQLSAWMRTNLEYAVFPFSGEVQQLESEIIKTCRPPLNLKGWRNPQRSAILRLRDRCKDEAMRWREETG